MNILMTALMTLAQVPASQPVKVEPPAWYNFVRSPLFLMMLMLAVFYVFMFRSKKTQEKQRVSMLDQLKRGDRVQTIGGILATVVDVKDSEVLLKVDESSNTKIRFARSAIHRVMTEEKEKVEAK